MYRGFQRGDKWPVNLFFPELKNDMLRINLHNCDAYCHYRCIRIKVTLETIAMDVTLAVSCFFFLTIVFYVTPYIPLLHVMRNCASFL